MIRHLDANGDASEHFWIQFTGRSIDNYYLARQ